MAVGYQTPSGQVITGKLGEVFAKQKPERGVSVPDTPADVIGRITGRGGGGGGRQVPLPVSAPDTTAKAQEIERQKQSELRQARQDFNKDIRQVTSPQARLDAISKLNQKITEITAKAGARQVEAGIITSYQAGASYQRMRGEAPTGVKVTKETAGAYQKALAGRQLTQEEVRRLEKAGAKFERTALTTEQLKKIPVSQGRTGWELLPVERKTTIQKIMDVPAKAFEKITKRTPSESFRFITGTEKKLGQKITAYELISEPPKAILSAPSILGSGSQFILEEAGYKGVKLPPLILPKPSLTGQPSFFLLKTKEEKILTPKQIGGVVEYGAYLTPVAPIFAPGMIIGGTEKVLSPKLPIEERIFGGIEAGFGLAIIGAKPYQKIFKEKIITKIPTRPLREPRGVIVTKPIRIARIPTTASRIKIIGELRPPTIIEETTRFKKFFGFAPKIKRIPAREFKIMTIEPIIGKGKALFGEVRGRYAKQAKLQLVKGTSIPTSIEELRKLPMQEQILYKRIAQDITGTSVSLKNVPKILSKHKQLVRSEIISKQAGILIPSKTGLEIKLEPKPGKITRTFISGSQITPLKSTPEFDLSKIRTRIKETTYPSLLKTQAQLEKLKTPGITLYEYRIKEPSVKEIKLLKPATIQKTPLSKTFQVLEKPSIILPGLPKVKAPKATTKIIKPEPILIKPLPASIYAGTGKYELSEFMKPSEILQPRISLGLQIKPKEIQKQPQIIKYKTKIIEGLKLPSISKETQIPKQKQKEIQKLRQIFKQIQRQIPEQKLAKISLTIQKKPPQKPLSIPKIPAPLLTKKIKPSKEEAVDLFKVFLRRKGADILLGTKESKREAREFLLGKIRGTLGASGFIEKAGRKLPFEELNLFGTEFRKGKREAFRIVERKEMRLRKGTTAKEIQYFRKGAKTKSLFSI